MEVNLDFFQSNNDSSTRVVNVDRDQSGDRFFSGFEPSLHSCFADEALSMKLIEKDILNLEKCFLRTKYLVTGTNVLSSSISAETIFFLLEQAKKSEVKVVIDLNWREVFWDYSNFASKNIKRDRINPVSYTHLRAHETS